MDLLKLIGIVIVVVGFALKWDTIATVVLAAVATGLVAVANGEMTFIGIFETLGKSFLGNRTATLFALTVGVIGICERYGLRDKAKDFIKSLKNLTVSGLLSIWTVIRTLSAAFSLRLGGHVQFIRPIILPMAEGELKGICAGSENFGNFFGQNCFMGASGTLLIVSTLNEQGFDQVDALAVATDSWPIAIIMMVIACAYYYIFNAKLKKRFSKKA
jgi:uncharacterized membrane protein